MTEDTKAQIFLAVCVAACVGLLLLIPRPAYQVVNCSIAEISPDFTPELREACRKLRTEAYDRTKSKTSN